MHKLRAPAFAAALVGLLLGGAANAAENAVPNCHAALATGSKAPIKTVVVVSDMIEHSGVTSFYKKSALRTIDPATEMAKVQAAGLIGNFGGTSVTVIGAGALPPGKPTARRGTAEMAALEAFWRQWFTASNAKLKEFGHPSLLQAIQ